MKFHDAANIEKCNMSRKITDLKEEDPLYVRATNPVTGERVYYVGGYPAKNRYDFTNELKTDDEFYDAIDEKMKAASTPDSIQRDSKCWFLHHYLRL